MAADQDNDDIERSISLAEKALGYIKYNQTSAAPEYYELWFNFASGINQELNTKIKNILSNQKRLNQDQIEQLYTDHCHKNIVDDRVEEISSKVSNELSDIMNMVGQSIENTEGYSESLEIFTSELTEIKDEGSLRMMISSMAAATFEMAQNTRELESNLSRSKQQISQLNENIETIRTESMTDALTGIANRKKFDTTMDVETNASRESGEPLTLLLCDIDHFKLFNDTYGHQTGDQVLRLVGSILKTNVKGRDLAARYGGEEFAVILPQTTLEDGAIVADQIRRIVMNKELVKKSSGKMLGRITLSIGVACYRPGDTIEDFIARADKCLYAAKHEGRNNVQTTETVDQNESASSEEADQAKTKKAAM